MLERRADEGACSDDPQARPRRCAVALSNARNSMVPFFSTSPSKGEKNQWSGKGEAEAGTNQRVVVVVVDEAVDFVPWQTKSINCP